LSPSGHPRDLHSFPTRRSSDLDAVERGLDVAVAGDRLADAAGTDQAVGGHRALRAGDPVQLRLVFRAQGHGDLLLQPGGVGLVEDRKSTRLNSSHVKISYAVFC